MTDVFVDGFVDAYSKSTGQKQRIPEHWLDHPVLGKDFTLTPSARAREDAAAAAPTAQEGLTPSSIADEPSDAWTRERLDRHAAGLDLDTTGLPNKGEVLAAIEAAATQISDGNPPTDQTPAAGENQE